LESCDPLVIEYKPVSIRAPVEFIIKLLEKV
jgi:hypothetical protein